VDVLSVSQSLYDQRARLGESPRWDEGSETLFWIDIDRGVLWSGALDGRRPATEAHRAAAPMGALVLDVEGRPLWAVEDRWHGPGEGEAWPWSLGQTHLRFNDAGVDAAGVMWSATMRRDETAAEVPDSILCRVSRDGAATVMGDLGIGNGIAWSPDDAWMYLVDSTAGVLRAPFEPGTGPVGEWSRWLSLTAGMPDGIAVDAEGGVWVACWGVGEVLRFDQTREVTHRLTLPTPTVTALTFAGPDLDVIICTTSSQDIPPDVDPLAGRLFVADCPVPGLDLYRAQGS
jgi:sugar lactone lactonase YvrE